MDTEQITVLLNRLDEDDDKARQDLFRQVYPELLSIARSRLSKHDQSSIEASDLVHDGYVRFCQSQKGGFASRVQFYAFIARVMRNLLIDRYRSKIREKRFGALQQTTLSNKPQFEASDAVDWYQLDQALQDLHRIREPASIVFELRYFMGFSGAETAKIMDVSTATVTRLWAFSKAWLTHRLLEQEA